VNGCTNDTIALRGAGVVRITQPAKGHRFTLDSILLADFCRIKPKDLVLEPGAGTGVISLLLAKKHPRAFFTAVEVQPQLIDLCERNITDNSLEGRTTVIVQDLRRLQNANPGLLQRHHRQSALYQGRHGPGLTTRCPADRPARRRSFSRVVAEPAPLSEEQREILHRVPCSTAGRVGSLAEAAKVGTQAAPHGASLPG